MSNAHPSPKTAFGRLNFPFTTGIYLAVNAISDACLLIDGPTCCFYKAENIQGNHDLHSTLLDCRGDHRIINTNLDLENIVLQRREEIAVRLRYLDEREDCRLILLASMPMAALVGVQYDTIIRDLAGSKPIGIIPSGSLSGNWLDGYGETLHTIAKRIDLNQPQPQPDKVALIGYFMDRCEEDHQGNLHEIKRMLSALSLEPVSIWLDGSGLDSLEAVKDAGTLISLPYGRKAATTLSERLSVPLIQLGLPFGLEGTSEWLRKVGTKMDREQQAEDFIDSELSQLVPKFEWLVPACFLERRIAILGEPCLSWYIALFLSELGCQVTDVVALGSESFWGVEKTWPCEVHYEPDYQWFHELYEKLATKQQVDLLITNSQYLPAYKRYGIPFLEFGYPNHLGHALYDAPFMGFRGAARFAEQVANRISLFRALKAEPDQSSL